jgi:tRNA-Thr(GGU) m(6)t(6)A37 methyltransferase TsaA
MKCFELEPIGYVSNNRLDLSDDAWGDVVSVITLRDDLPPDLLMGLDGFSHVEVVFIFHQIDSKKELPAARHPRNNPKYPKVGLLAQRSAYHPNPIGLTPVRILKIAGRELTVQGLDAVNGSPVLDLKPVFKEFQIIDPKQPGWVSELLKDYWIKSP